MTSIRELITRVKTAGATIPKSAWPGNVSLLRDFWCYNHPPDDSLLSLRWQWRMLAKRHFHLNLIRVGDAMLTESKGRKINGAVHRVREVYAAANLAVVRIEHRAISTDRAGGREVLDSKAEARALTNEWTVSNNGVDVFLVASTWPNEDDRVVTGGNSPENGSCDKDDADDMTGVVVSTDSSKDTVSLIMAHELGHYFGLPHQPDKTIGEVVPADQTVGNIRNLMFPLQIGGSELTSNQVQIIADHCFVFAPG